MLTVGVDLAAEPKNTAVAVLEWTTDAVVVVSIACPADDAAIVAACDGAAKIGIDCPLGWPEEFVEFVTAHRAGRPVAAADTIAARRPLAYRATDVHCQRLGMRPLSVSADRIGHAAFRAAGLLTQLGSGTDRSGAGRIVETYPAGSLRRWGGFAVHGYKGRAGIDALTQNAAALLAALPLHFADPLDGQRFTSVDHVFDAVVAAITARLAMVAGRVEPIPPELRDLARVEGWIAVPTCALTDLRSLLQQS